ncbi:MAG: hypothetical protein ACYSU6_03665 [Planctomycetota bacterium]|jgi:hypothetical protein
MEQRLTTIQLRVASMSAMVLGAVLLFSCKPRERSTNTMSPPREDQNTTSSAVYQSQRLLQRALALKQITLPDQWYSAQGDTVAERFEATSRAMQAQNPDAARGRELMARYENDDQPFIHSVWLNQPLICKLCGRAGADGFHTVVSVERNQMVTITAKEAHEVTAHQGSLAAAKLEVLRHILVQE